MGPPVLTALDKALEGVERLAIDSAPIIYFIEENPRYLEPVDEVFGRVDAGSIAGITSALTLTEVLTLPIRQGKSELRASYMQLLLAAEHFSTLPINTAMAAVAAELRARYGIRTPDALQIACAVEAECDAFLTNDIRLRKVAEIPVIVLDELLEDEPEDV